ncbi:type IX secretion system membrane protein PorP/SprF [Flavisolibacter tropicus]|uniref:Membrane protein n=1 Tax=Flavisolibacter tropicus TaxID=1492898 RepID=A0A172U1Q9_9BACT|nr:type IX secretion system membrane protein PorP/SprF [Flavisolibacter tropicus]ANE53186.1 membrane protein [Flavisolibacter tropicus]
MRKIAFGLLGILFCHLAQGQQKPHYTQYILNQYVLNPALTGIENYTDVKIGHRRQWEGIEDAPVTTYFTIHTPIHKSDYRTTATSYQVPGENPRGQRYWENYTAAEPHHGVGFQVINDQTGPLNYLSAYATYAYHLGLSPRTSLSAGFGLGATSLTLNTSKLQFATPGDPVANSRGNVTRIKPDLNAGLYLYSADYFIGISAQQLIPSTVSFSDRGTTPGGQLVPHFFASAGYRFLVGEDFNLIPSVLVKYVNPTPPQVDVNFKLQYHDLLWVGGSYRSQDGFAGMLGLNVSNTFNIGYSYDYTTSRLNQFSKGNHEIVLGFLIGNKYDDSCPRNIW